MYLALFRELCSRGVIPKSPAGKAYGVWKDVYDYVHEKLFGKVGSPVPTVPKGTELAAKFKVSIVELELKYGLAATARKELAGYLDTHLDELHEKINLVAELTNEATKCPVLFVVEGTDKTDTTRAREIFSGHTNALTTFQAAAIYTFPITLAYSTEFNQLKTAFDQRFALPNLKLSNHDGSNNAEGKGSMRTIILERIDPGADLVDRESLDLFVGASGGVVLSIIRLVQQAAVHAISRGSACIEKEDAAYAITQERGDFVRVLDTSDYPILKERHGDKVLSSDGNVQRLLHCLALLEYENDVPWCDVHPIVLPLVQERAT